MIVYWVICFLIAGGCIGLLHRFGVIANSRRAISITLESLGTIQNPVMNDDAKEAALQQYSRQLFKIAFVMIPGIIGALAVPIAFAMLGDYAGWISTQTLLSVAYSPLFLVACVLIALLIPRRKKDPTATYSSMDRLLHRLAFRTGLAQILISKSESRLVAGKLAGCSADRPVFITGLPRAGTTLILECLADHPELASHCYRNMPFVLTPYLWHSFSTRFHLEGSRRERAHGDGMKIDFDSPEALEEVVWKNFWNRQYLEDRIQLWDNVENDDFLTFFREHQRKIILTRRAENTADVRYISKNNLNMARMAFLGRHFPASTFIIPFRDPLQHAASLLRQHVNFLQQHARDPFIAEYMEAIGHFDFGIHLRPIDFDGWLNHRASEGPLQLSFWVEYWQACYQHLLNHTKSTTIHLIHYDRLCLQPGHDLSLLGKTLGLNDLDPLLQHAHDIRPPRSHSLDTDCLDHSLKTNVYSIYEELQARCLT